LYQLQNKKEKEKEKEKEKKTTVTDNKHDLEDEVRKIREW